MRNIRNGLLTAAVLVLTAAGIPAATAQSPDVKALADKVAKQYEVTVLRTTQGEIDGKAVVYLTVMKGAGNSNDAFQVTTLAVDPATGQLVSQYRTTPTGQVDAAPGPLSPNAEPGEMIRQLSTRPTER
jgi:hypothetical protein